MVSGCGALLRVVAVLAACLFALSEAGVLHAQGHRSKVPLVGKLSSGSQQQAYSGKIQSLNLKEKILNVTSRHGRQTEIFRVKKNVRVENVTGSRMNLTDLTPGMSVLIYFDQKSGALRVKNIVILSSGKSQGKGRPAPST